MPRGGGGGGGGGGAARRASTLSRFIVDEIRSRELVVYEPPLPANRKARDLRGRFSRLSSATLQNPRRSLAIPIRAARRAAPPLRLTAPRERLLARPSSRRHAAAAAAAAPHLTAPFVGVRAFIRSFARSLARTAKWVCRTRESGLPVLLSRCRWPLGVRVDTHTTSGESTPPCTSRPFLSSVGINRLGSPRASCRVASRHIALRRDATRA